ncbi:metal-dependent hydrolase [Arthrobacter sp. StoSoilB5]|uniref:metal-dependent hydrolase n=1 Tax=Arthrobacter sp. StoSoilB5 TaxID=2830992 RepID=UPI001CC6D3CC|nr:metal-dependent hydrolase [Arthrobacter sp. StoSoilB5]BCW44740.1 metal-dependent hydrolase [Arthrobacter sp. StoSoilB5]
MSEPLIETTVSYPSGALTSTGTVLRTVPVGDGRQAVILDTTACHPTDSAWPDQGPDKGELIVDSRPYPILDCVVGATDGNELQLGPDVRAKKGSEGWTFFAAHIIDSDEEIAEGTPASVSIDAAHRRNLSAGHTACHAASLALNAQLAGMWSKDVSTDGLGHPNFDAAAIDTSTIHELTSVDVYRLGKSLRRKGFNAAEFVENLATVEQKTNALLEQWRQAGAPISIETDGDKLIDRRYWVTTLEDQEVRIPCGGTHITDLGDLSAITVTLLAEDADGGKVVTMTTSAQ